MVTTTDTTKIVTTPKLQDPVQPSVKRWLKHLFYLPMSKRYFSQQDQKDIAAAVQKAEQDHVGEIQVVIEGHLPSQVAYHMDTRLRAQQLFAELGVWDTEHNSGVLLYLNLCEQTVEIVIDRGIKQLTTQQCWDTICSEMITALKNRQYKQSVCDAVNEIGRIFNEFDQLQHATVMNELSDLPIILK